MVEKLENFESKVALSGFFDIGGDLARPIASSAMSPGDCCRICSEHPLCTSWNYFAEPIPTSSPLSLPSWLRKGCSLKGSVPSHRLIHVTHTFMFLKLLMLIVPYLQC